MEPRPPSRPPAGPIGDRPGDAGPHRLRRILIGHRSVSPSSHRVLINCGISVQIFCFHFFQLVL